MNSTTREMTFQINGRQHSVVTDPDRPLLDILREDLQLTGTKYGCGEGECGACTVLIEGEAVRSCITAAIDADGQAITTIEGLAESDEQLHPVQQAFLAAQAMQCGYCVPGQILTAVALLNENPRPNRDQILSAMQGNLCRCCNYSKILEAVEQAAASSSEAPSS
jgi:aerobic-type carbon monoxide dehydrogenase small subunit (CoxS/CutS family)